MSDVIDKLLQTKQLADLVGCHENTIRHYLKTYSDFIPHRKIGAETMYEPVAVDRIDEIRKHIEAGLKGQKLVSHLTSKYGITLKGESLKTDSQAATMPSHGATTTQTNANQATALTTINQHISQAQMQLEYFTDQVLKTQGEHQIQLERKQAIIDGKNSEIGELENEVLFLKGQVNRLERKIKMMRWTGWREPKE